MAFPCGMNNAHRRSREAWRSAAVLVTHTGVRARRAVDVLGLYSGGGDWIGSRCGWVFEMGAALFHSLFAMPPTAEPQVPICGAGLAYERPTGGAACDWLQAYTDRKGNLT